MPLLPTDECWTASIEGTDLSLDFWMPCGASEGEAAMRAWTIWSHARGAGSTVERPYAAYGLKVALSFEDQEIARAAEQSVIGMLAA